MLLAGKTAIVTGGASGIGLAICQRFALDGASVAVWDIDEAGARRVAAELVAAGTSAIGCGVDVSNRLQIVAATERVRAELGPAGILVNNAGISGFAPFLEITEEAWDRMVGINLKGVFLCTQVVIPDMLEVESDRDLDDGIAAPGRLGTRAMDRRRAGRDFAAPDFPAGV